MSDRRGQAIGAALFMLFALAGWGPYFVATATSGVYLSTAVLLGGFFAILAAGFTYDAAERLFGEGKGIYAAAVLLTFPPAGIVFSEPPMLSYTSMMFVVSASMWFAARATKASLRESLFFIVLLSGVAFASFGPWPPAILSLATLFVLRERTGTAPRTLLLAAGISLLGLVAKQTFRFELPSVAEREPDIALSVVESILLIAPWFAFGVLSIFRAKTWTRNVVVGVIVLTALHVYVGGEWIGLVGAGAPLLALAVTSALLGWFEAETEGRERGTRWTALPLIVVLVAFVIARIANAEGIVLSRNYATVGLLIAALLTVSMIRDARRWVFALHAAAGLYAGGLWWYYWQENAAETSEISIDLAPWLLVIALLARAGSTFIYGRRMPRRLRAPGPPHRFDPVVFRVFSDVRRKTWEGTPVEVSPKSPECVKFAIFGDVAGAESPFAGRNSGYFAFQKLAKDIEANGAEFAVSTGDLAPRATHFAYRRLRKLLKRITVPMIATPGNHDIVFQRKVHAQFFHALFGSDHGDVTVGPVRMILINNAWGSLSDEQLTWVEETLAKESSGVVTIVFCHKPVFDPREDTYYGMEHRPHAERLHELFVQHHVSAVFSGHIHSLLNTEKDGVNYIISGGGGSKLKTANDAHHYLQCEGTSAGLLVNAVAIDTGETLLELKIPARA